MKNGMQVEYTELDEQQDVVISGRDGVQDFSCFGISVMLSTRMGKTDDKIAYKESGKRKASGTMSSVWGITNLRHPGDLEERFG